VIVSPKRLLLVLVLARLLVACELMTGLSALHETAGGGPEGAGGDAATGDDSSTRGDAAGVGGDAGAGADGAPDDGAIADVRGLTDVVVPPGNYLLHVLESRAHVTSDIPAIYCGLLAPDGGPPICDAVFPAGTQLVLTATGSGTFDGWGGDCSDALTNQCNLTMTSDRLVIVSYSLNH
jgi:hypothetical protein